MDFYDIVVQDGGKRSKTDYIVTVDFLYCYSRDLACKGGNFYAFWDESTHLWNTDLNVLYNQIDNQIFAKKKEMEEDPKYAGMIIKALTMRAHSSGKVSAFTLYLKQMTNDVHQFNTRIFFQSDKTKKSDYVTTKLSYDPTPGSCENFDELIGCLYSKEDVDTILWCIGLILTGQTSKVQKFLYLYGPKGSGKGTVIRTIRGLFEDYCAEISLKFLTSSSEFATSQVQEAPLLLDDDADIAKMNNDVNLLKLTGHDVITVNKKYSKLYDVICNGMVIAASNQRYQVRNVDAGITRRAMVVEPLGVKISRSKYERLYSQIKFEIPAIAQKAIDHVNKVGLYVYEDVVDVGMAEATDLIFSFVREHEDQFGYMITLKQAAILYKEFLEDLGYDTRGYKRRIKIELQRYYHTFNRSKRIDGQVYENVYEGFRRELAFPEEYAHLGFGKNTGTEGSDGQGETIVMGNRQSAFDRVAKNYPAQYTTEEGFPLYKWDDCTTTLKTIDTHQLHYVRVPMNHIVIDFDLKDSEGNKNLLLNLNEASKYPATYAEVSKSGCGVHLHYIYDGDPSMLATSIKPDVEIKVYSGKSSLRRKLTECNNRKIAHISSGLPFREERKVDRTTEVIIWNEKKLRTMIENNLRRQYHDATKPSIDFIADALERAEESGTKYDVTDMRNAVLSFAMGSSHQKAKCLEIVAKMKFKNLDEEVDIVDVNSGDNHIVPDSDIYFYDVEVFPNLFLVVYKRYGEEKHHILFNPTPLELEPMLNLPLVGFFNRNYDNHMVYKAYMGASNAELFNMSQRLTDNDSTISANAKIGAAYELSYADIYEYSAAKMSLKKHEIRLGIKHDEFEFPWDQPLPEDQWERCAEYCCNDVDATEAVFNDIYPDYQARLILSKLSGLSVNATTQQHAAAYVFEGNKKANEQFIYTDLSETFPGYEFKNGKSSYKGIDPSEGGYVYSEPGIYNNVVLLDVESMHPTSLIEMGYFGAYYTQRFKELKDARLAIKHHDFELAKTLLNGELASYINEQDADSLSYALKIIINIIYGMTSAKFENAFSIPGFKNKDNIVAKRGALFMIDLQLAIQEMGFTVAHVKTDSIKIVDATDEVISFVHQFGARYGYTFEHEATYSKFALINKADYICQYGWAEKEKKIGTWEATGARFAQPFIYKTLFDHTVIELEDFALTKSARAPIYIDEKFIGKTARIYASLTGGEVTRRDGDKIGAISGTKGYKWKLFEELKDKKDIDMGYYVQSVEDSLEQLQKVGCPGKIIDFDKIPKQYESFNIPF